MCVAKQYSPQFSQVTVGCTEARVATKVDVKCLDAQQHVVLIENKIGFSGYYEAADGELHWPYKGVESSSRTHHQLQLAFTRALYERRFPGVCVKRENCVVWRYDENGVTEYPLEAWAVAGVKHVFERWTDTA